MRHLSSTILAVLTLISLWSETRLYSQTIAEFSLINDRTSFGPVVLDEANAYCYWPRSVVTEPAISAVELSTGRHLWTKPALLAMPYTYRIEEGWLQYETTEGEQMTLRRSIGPRTFHLVNSATGVEWSFPTRPELRSNVDGTWVHHDRCLTHQGDFVRCSDGKTIGNLGPGEHQTIVNDHDFLVTTLIPDEKNTCFVKRLLRRYDLETMRVEREMELPLEVSWRIVAATGDVVVGRTETTEREPFLACIDLAEQKERWRVAIPFSIRMSPFEWSEDHQLKLTMGAHGLIRPLRIDMATGTLSPDLSWRDPRLLLAWHQEAGQYPDFVSYNENYIIGRWRFIQLSCVDSRTGQLIWNQGTSNHQISRMFGAENRLGDYFVAESRQGFDIVSVANGDRLTISIEQVGLTATPQKSTSDEEIEPVELLASVLANSSEEWLWSQGLLLGPLIPFVGWMLWSLIRR